MKHKWHKEIIHWANGGEIEVKENDEDSWSNVDYPSWDNKFGWEYRIKPTPKEPQYLYVYRIDGEIKICKGGEITQTKTANPRVDYVGKIKLEQDDV